MKLEQVTPVVDFIWGEWLLSSELEGRAELHDPCFHSLNICASVHVGLRCSLNGCSSCCRGWYPGG